jgi:hypothetical protein
LKKCLALTPSDSQTVGCHIFEKSLRTINFESRLLVAHTFFFHKKKKEGNWLFCLFFYLRLRRISAAAATTAMTAAAATAMYTSAPKPEPVFGTGEGETVAVGVDAGVDVGCVVGGGFDVGSDDAASTPK